MTLFKCQMYLARTAKIVGINVFNLRQWRYILQELDVIRESF